jgi:hypothetical protein
MAFSVTVYVPEGIVMASDSRQAITIERRTSEGEKLPPLNAIASDFAYNTFLLKQPRIGISVWGNLFMGGERMESHLKRLEEEKLDTNDTVVEVIDKLMSYFRERVAEANAPFRLDDGDGVDEVTNKLTSYFGERSAQADTTFHVAGFRKEAGVSTPHVYMCHAGRNERNRVNFEPQTGRVKYGCTWGGQSDVASTMLKPHQVLGPDNKPMPAPRIPIIYESMNLQDAIDFAIYAVRTTIDTIRFQARPKTVGGAIDVLLITPEEARWIQRKELHGRE